MSRIAIAQQLLHSDALKLLVHEWSAGNEIRGDVLLNVVEQFAGNSLPAELRKLLLKASIPERKSLRRVRALKHSGSEGFVLEQVDRIYPWLLGR